MYLTCLTGSAGKLLVCGTACLLAMSHTPCHANPFTVREDPAHFQRAQSHIQGYRSHFQVRSQSCSPYCSQSSSLSCSSFFSWSSSIAIGSDTVRDKDNIFRDFENQIKIDLQWLDAWIQNKNTGDIREAFLRNDSILKDVWDGIQQIRRSTDIYRIQYANDPLGDGRVHIDPSTGDVLLLFNKGTKHQKITGHEIYHGIQYERGLVSIKFDQQAGRLYDLQDEISADIVMELAANPAMLDLSWIERSEQNDPLYLQLPRTSTNLDSSAGLDLRTAIISAAGNDQPIPEFYKGWQFDYSSHRRTALVAHN